MGAKGFRKLSLTLEAIDDKNSGHVVESDIQPEVENVLFSGNELQECGPNSMKQMNSNKEEQRTRNLSPSAGLNHPISGQKRWSKKLDVAISARPSASRATSTNSEKTPRVITLSGIRNAI